MTAAGLLCVVSICILTLAPAVERFLAESAGGALATEPRATQQDIRVAEKHGRVPGGLLFGTCWDRHRSPNPSRDEELRHRGVVWYRPIERCAPCRRVAVTYGGLRFDLMTSGPVKGDATELTATRVLEAARQ